MKDAVRQAAGRNKISLHFAIYVSHAAYLWELHYPIPRNSCDLQGKGNVRHSMPHDIIHMMFENDSMHVTNVIAATFCISCKELFYTIQTVS
jgi:hypothetical protein